MDRKSILSSALNCSKKSTKSFIYRLFFHLFYTLDKTVIRADSSFKAQEESKTYNQKEVFQKCHVHFYNISLQERHFYNSHYMHMKQTWYVGVAHCQKWQVMQISTNTNFSILHTLKFMYLEYILYFWSLFFPPFHSNTNNWNRIDSQISVFVFYPCCLKKGVYP